MNWSRRSRPQETCCFIGENQPLLVDQKMCVKHIGHARHCDMAANKTDKISALVGFAFWGRKGIKQAYGMLPGAA